LWSQNPVIRDSAERELELSTVGARADALVTISDASADDLRQLHSQHVLVIENGFDISGEAMRANLQRARPARTGPARIVHTGMLYPGLRDPEPLLRAIVDLASEGRLAAGDLTLDFYGARIAVAEDLARNPAYAPFVRILGHVPRDEALKAQLEADRLLLLESPDPAHRAALTGKIFEYIASGTPVLSVGSPQGTAIWNLIAETGAGICCGTDQQAMGRELLLLQEMRGQPDWYRPKADEILKYSRERQAGQLLDFILGKLDQPRRHGSRDS
jgi:glycosyltransferase involved in cell wall biosynthesis